MRRVGIAVAAATLALAGCGGSGGFEVSGTVDLITFDSSDVLSLDEGCAGSGGYDDLIEGADVVVRDSNGKKVGVGELGPGETPDEGGGCTWPFKITDVSSGGGDIYSVEVANRGEVSFKKKDADSLALSIGG